MTPNINNKKALILIGLSILTMSIGLMLVYLNPESYIAAFISNLGFGLASLLCLIMLIRNGGIRYTLYWRGILVCIGIGIIGALFKIQHWVGGSFLLPISLIAIAITYSIRFFKKPVKQFLDVLKFAWAFTTFVGTALFFLHYIPKELLLVGQILLWLTVIDFLVIGFKNRTILTR